MLFLQFDLVTCIHSYIHDIYIVLSTEFKWSEAHRKNTMGDLYLVSR